MLRFWKTAFMPLPVLILFAPTARADTMLSTGGIFAATGTSGWSNTSFQGSSFAVPLSGSADVILGTFTHPLASGASITGGGAPDFSLTITIPGSTGGQSSHTFLFDISGSIYNAWGWRGGYDICSGGGCLSQVNPVIPITYTTAEGSGAFDLQLRGVSNAAYPNFVRLNPGGTGYIGGRITNAEFTPASSTPEPASAAMLGAALIALGAGLKRLRR